MKILISHIRAALRRLPPLAAAVFSAAMILALGWPHQALAQDAMSLGDMMCNVFDTFDPFIGLMNALAYTAGGILIGSGLLALKEHAENPQTKLHQAIARLIGGAALLGLPWFGGFIINTLFLTPGGNGLNICMATPSQQTGGTTGLDVLVTNFVNNIEGPFTSLVSGAAIVMGVLFIIRGLMKGAKYGTDPRANSATHILTYLIIGAILIVVGQAFNEVFGSIFGGFFPGVDSVTGNTSTVLSWTAVQNLGGNTPFATAIAAALTFFQLIGMLAFVRGWYIVKNAIEGGGQATVAQGFTHIVGGVLAINIYSFLQIMDVTFGTNLLVM